MMNKENLQLMSTMLGEVIDGTWKGIPVDHKVILGPVKLFPERVTEFDLESWVDSNPCGYSACAVGHACFDKRFQALGLSFKKEIPVLTVKHPSVEGHVTLTETRWDAVSCLFEISVDAARTLFLDKHYTGYIKYGVSAKRVKSRVDELLQIGEKALIAKYPYINVEDEAARARPVSNNE